MTALVLVDPAKVLGQLRYILAEDPDGLVDAVDALLAQHNELADEPEPEWCVFYGGEDPDNAAGVKVTDEEAVAREDAQWLVESGVAVRMFAHTEWVVQPAEEAGP